MQEERHHEGYQVDIPRDSVIVLGDGLCQGKIKPTSGGPDFRQPQALLRISVSRTVRADIPAAPLGVAGLGVVGVDIMISLLEVM